MTQKKTLYIGVLIFIIGILLRWFIESLVSPDGDIQTPILVFVIALLQTVAIVTGMYLIIKRPEIRVPSKTEFYLLFLGVFIALTLLEVGSRIWLNYFASPQQYRSFTLYTDLKPGELRWSPHHYLNYDLTPNYRRGLTSHNSLGFRDREFSLQKPDGVYRIVALGGSTTYTVMVEDNEKTFTANLERTLKKQFGYKNIEVINAGVEGFNSWETLINLAFRVLDLNPDLIIIYHGTNDVHTRLVEPSAYEGDNSGRRKQWRNPSVPFLDYSCILRILRRKFGYSLQVGLGSFVNASTYLGAGTDPVERTAFDPLELLQNNPPNFFRRNLTNIIAIAKAHNIEVLLATWAHSPHFNDYAFAPHYQLGFQENNEVVKELAAQYGVALFNFAKEMPKDKRYWSDGRHVNEEGAALKAELFAEFIHTLNLVTY